MRILEYFKRKVFLFNIQPPTSVEIKYYAESEEDDPPSDVQTMENDVRLGTAEGQSFVIEYLDTRGNLSERSITVWNVGRGGADGVPTLLAKCHLRQATRSFRIDRIRYVRDLDGVFADSIPQFLVDTFGMDPQLANLAQPNLPSIGVRYSAGKVPVSAKQTRWHEQRQQIRPYAVLWVLLSRADSAMHPKEVEAACDGFEAVVGAHADRLRFKQYFKTLRPSARQVEQAFASILNESEYNRELFAHVCREIVIADGIVVEHERSMMQELAGELSMVTGGPT